ncbi:class I SAM-dependent methyltransferase [Desulfococcus sp.]|uniref:class I SAM-dependent methyltransferase n=1 Tax=Desulfococcus sp. TaxID=2025834 RepID=UPI003593EF13
MPEQESTAPEDFSRKMIDILNYGALNLAVGIGYRTGLFDAMDACSAPQTAEAVAREAGMNRRYVEEWLGVMCTGGIVTLTTREDGTAEYLLPRSHADILTRRAGSGNLGVYAQEIPLLTLCAMEKVLDGFRTGEGVPYADYPKFQAFMTELANAKHRQVLIDLFLPTVDGGRMAARLQKGIRVCDLGCGEGVALTLMAAAFPASRFTGIDMDPEVIRIAESAAAEAGLDNARFLVRDAAALGNGDEFENAFDYITAFDAIHDQREPLAALKSVRRMLPPGGCFSMIDIDAGSAHQDNMAHPMGPFLYTVSLMHCMPVGLADNGAGLGMMWGREKAVALLSRAGFDAVEVVEMPHDPFNIHYFCRK